MKLEIFQFLEKSIEHMDNNIEFINTSSDALKKFFNDIFLNCDFFINTTARIKSEDSIREKLLKNNYYYKYPNHKVAIENLPDLIGIRVECRFIDDEQKIYDEISKNFTIQLEDGYFRSELNSNIELNLSEKQPTFQKNGFEIYKIDGRYVVEGDYFVNFELQIKSLVNIFWGEIDHRVLYKNFNYMITEDFIRSIMFSIKANLSMIDNQLQSVYNHLKNVEDKSNYDSSKIQLKTIVSKMLHDLYSVKIKESTGFVVDFKDCADIIVDYIFSKNKYYNSMKYEDYFVKFLNRLNGANSRTIIIGETFEIVNTIEFKNDLCEKFGLGLLDLVNKDFKWNLIFSVIRDIEENDFSEEFVLFSEFIVYAVVKRVKRAVDDLTISNEDKSKLKWDISYVVMEFICNSYSPNLITFKSMKEIENKIRYFLKNVDQPEEILALNYEDLYNSLENNFVKKEVDDFE